MTPSALPKTYVLDYFTGSVTRTEVRHIVVIALLGHAIFYAIQAFICLVASLYMSFLYPHSGYASYGWFVSSTRPIRLVYRTLHKIPFEIRHSLDRLPRILPAGVLFLPCFTRAVHGSRLRVFSQEPSRWFALAVLPRTAVGRQHGSGRQYVQKM